MKKVAVLITCHNRKNKTIVSLDALKKSIEYSDLNVKFDVYVVDDGSTDGTSAAILAHFPKTNIIVGNGNLFWAGGMRLAWSSALSSKPCYYLLLNDDTFLFENSIDKLLRTSMEYYKKRFKHAILVGSTVDTQKKLVTYGGRKLYSKNKPESFLIKDNDELVECDLANANIMLVPHEIVKRIGILSDKYTHSIADYDYTLRARKFGFQVLVHPGTMGTCEFDHGKNWMPVNSRLKERIKYLRSPKGLSYKEYLYFIRKHFPLNLPSAFTKLWIKTLFPIVYDKFKK
ncbi:MAG: glycosyltransferase family 2 protein [Chitinophagaceae bacterium]|nr:glycosyltransferase family 2 protein [Chitinophagaceae bacterium]